MKLTKTQSRFMSALISVGRCVLWGSSMQDKNGSFMFNVNYKTMRVLTEKGLIKMDHNVNSFVITDLYKNIIGCYQDAENLK